MRQFFGEFVALGPDLFQLLGQLFLEFVQFHVARGDPLCDQGREPAKPHPPA
jgi:hypothetical protein